MNVLIVAFISLYVCRLDIKQLLQAKAEVELELQKWQNKMEEKSIDEQSLRYHILY